MRILDTAPDRILLGGNILTVDAAFGRAEAVAIRGERIVATGTSEEVRALAGPSTRIDDLAGRTVIPGLIDTHAHVEMAGLLRFTVDFAGVSTMDEAVERVAAHARGLPAGGWVLGQMWHPQSQLAEKRFPTRVDLDRAAPDHPVYLPVGHYALLNSRALAECGITRETPDPEGGEIARDGSGEPTGVLVEAAERLVAERVPPWDDATRMAQLRDAQAYFNRFGITSAVSGAVSPRDARLYHAIRRRGEQTLRLGLMFAPTGELNPAMTVEEWEHLLAHTGVASEFGDEWLSLSGLKLQVDGGMTLRTAWTRAPYFDDPDYHGLVVIEPERFRRLVASGNRLGWRFGVHAVGDAAVDAVLDAFEAAGEEVPIAGRRFIVIHGSLMLPDQMDRARAMDVRVDAQSVFLWRKAGAIARFMGRETAERAKPLRSMIDRMGIDAVGAGTDYPINELDPFVNMYVMTTRRDANGDVWGPSEAITREEALRLYTSAAARYTFCERLTGSIEPGKLADFAILSDDPMAVPDEALKEIVAVETIVGGRTVHAGAPGD